MNDAIVKTFQYAVANKSTVEILHKGQTEWVTAQPNSMWTDNSGASGIMPVNSGIWPRTFRFSEMIDARIVHESDHCAAETATGVQ